MDWHDGDGGCGQGRLSTPRAPLMDLTGAWADQIVKGVAGDKAVWDGLPKGVAACVLVFGEVLGCGSSNGLNVVCGHSSRFGLQALAASRNPVEAEYMVVGCLSAAAQPPPRVRSLSMPKSSTVPEQMGQTSQQRLQLDLTQSDQALRAGCPENTKAVGAIQQPF